MFPAKNKYVTQKSLTFEYCVGVPECVPKVLQLKHVSLSHLSSLAFSRWFVQEPLSFLTEMLQTHTRAIETETVLGAAHLCREFGCFVTLPPLPLFLPIFLYRSL